MKMGPTDDFANFINAVIDERSFDKIKGYIDQAKEDNVDFLNRRGLQQIKGLLCRTDHIGHRRSKNTELWLKKFLARFLPSMFTKTKTLSLSLTWSTTVSMRLLVPFSLETVQIFEYMTSRLENAAGNFMSMTNQRELLLANNRLVAEELLNKRQGRVQMEFDALEYLYGRLKKYAVSPKDYRYPFSLQRLSIKHKKRT